MESMGPLMATAPFSTWVPAAHLILKERDRCRRGRRKPARDRISRTAQERRICRVERQMRRASHPGAELRLRAGMPHSVKAEIGSRRRIVGAVALRAVGRGVLASRNRDNGNRAIVDILVVVIGRLIVIGRTAINRTAIIGVGIVRRARAADHSACGNRAGPPASVMVTMAIAVPGTATTAVPGRAAA